MENTYTLVERKDRIEIVRDDGSVCFKLTLQDMRFAQALLANLNDDTALYDKTDQTGA